MKKIENTIRVNSDRTVRRSRFHSVPGSRIHVHILLIHQLDCIDLIAVLSPRLHNVVRHVTRCGRIFPLVRKLMNSVMRHFPRPSSGLYVGAAVVNGSYAVVISGVFFGSVARGLLIFSVGCAGFHCECCFGREPSCAPISLVTSRTRHCPTSCGIDFDWSIITRIYPRICSTRYEFWVRNLNPPL